MWSLPHTPSKPRRSAAWASRTKSSGVANGTGFTSPSVQVGRWTLKRTATGPPRPTRPPLRDHCGQRAHRYGTTAANARTATGPLRPTRAPLRLGGPRVGHPAIIKLSAQLLALHNPTHDTTRTTTT